MVLLMYVVCGDLKYGGRGGRRFVIVAVRRENSASVN